MPRISFGVIVGYNALIQRRTRKNRKIAVQKGRSILLDRDLALRSERLRSRVLVTIGLDADGNCSADPQFGGTAGDPDPYIIALQTHRIFMGLTRALNQSELPV
jgi:hypothetical protein